MILLTFLLADMIFLAVVLVILLFLSSPKSSSKKPTQTRKVREDINKIKEQIYGD